MPARICGINGRTGPQGWEGGNDDRSRDGAGDGRDDEYGNEHKGRDGGENGSGNEDVKRDKGGEERESGNLRYDYRGGSENTRGEATPISN